MAEGQPARSGVVPVLVAALICDSAIADPITGKKNLIGVFDNLWVRQFPTERPLSLYWKITDAEGHYEVKARIVHADKDRKIGEAKGQVDVPNRLAVYDFLINLPTVPLKEPGRYEFQIFMNEVYLGRAVLDAQPMPEA